MKKVIKKKDDDEDDSGVFILIYSNPLIICANLLNNCCSVNFENLFNSSAVIFPLLTSESIAFFFVN